MNARSAWVLALAVAAVACKQRNPRWLGPAGEDDATTGIADDDDGATVDGGMTTGGPGDACAADAECSAGLVCGPMGTCQQGVAGEPCDDESDCHESAPLCGGEDTCQVGAEGDPCVDDGDCGEAAPRCGPSGQCQDGSEGDPCGGNGDCGEAAPKCGPNDTCQDGSPGDPCDNPPDCQNGCMGGVCD